MDNIGLRLKEKRKELNLSVPALGLHLQIPPDRIYKWEKGTKPSDMGDYKKIERFLESGLETFPRETEPTQASEPTQPYLNHRQEQKMTVSTYMVPLVPIKAQAGYITSHELTDFIEKLEKFPMAPGINPRGHEWRWFEVAGESMEPTLFEGDYILCSLVNQEDWRNLEDFYLYCIVTVGNMWVKRIVKTKNGTIVLHSDNTKVKQRDLNLEEIREIWKVRRHLNARMPAPEKIKINNT